MTSASITEASKKDDLVLDWVPCIYFIIQFKKKVWALINFGSKVNAMTLVYALKLGRQIHRTNVRAQKFDGSTFETFEMILPSFQVQDSAKKARFFQKTFY